MDDVAKHCKKELEDAEKCAAEKFCASGILSFCLFWSDERTIGKTFRAMALQSKCEPKLKSLADCIRTNQQKDLKPCEDSLVAFVGCIDDFANNK